MQEISLLPLAILVIFTIFHLAVKVFFKPMAQGLQNGYWSIVLILSTWQLYNFANSFDEIGRQYLLDNFYGVFLGIWLFSSLVAIYEQSPLGVLGMAFSVATGIRIALDILLLGVLNNTEVIKLISIPTLALVLIVTGLSAYKSFKINKPNSS